MSADRQDRSKNQYRLKALTVSFTGSVLKSFTITLKTRGEVSFLISLMMKQTEELFTRSLS